MMYRRAALVPALVCLGLSTAPASATPPEGDVERTDLAEGTSSTPIHIVTDGTPTTLSVQSLTLHPGAGSGWHSHPGPEHSAITQGSVRVQTATDCAGTDFGAGQALFIPAGVVHRVTNVGPVPAIAVTTYTLPADADPRLDAAEGCPS